LMPLGLAGGDLGSAAALGAVRMIAVFFRGRVMGRGLYGTGRRSCRVVP